MYCRNCGNDVPNVNTPCTKCGFLPLNGADYCQECGFPTKEEQMVCINCQNRLKFAPKPTTNLNSSFQSNHTHPQYQSDDDIPNTGANIAACCSTPFTGGLPIVGLILYLIWKDEKPIAAKSVCVWSLAPFIVALILWIIFFILGGFAQFFYR